MNLLALVAVLLAAPAPAKPAPAAAAAAAEAAANAAAEQRAADAARAEQLQKAVEAAQKAAEAAAKAAEAAQKAAEAAAAKAAPPAATAAVAPPPAAPPAPAAPPPVAWTGQLSGGLILVSGNANSLTSLVSGKFERKGPEWTFAIRAGGAYGRTTVNVINNGVATDVSQVSALAANLGMRADRKVGGTFALFLDASLDTDHVKSIDWRPLGELGVAMTWWETKEGDLAKSSLRTDFGLVLGKEFRYQFYPESEAKDVPDSDIVAPRLGLAFRYAVTKDLVFTEDLNMAVALPLSGQATRLVTTSQSKLSAKVTASSALGLALGVVNDSAPPAGKKDTDVTLAITIDIAL